MNTVWRTIRDPRVSTVVVLAAVVLAGVALVGLGYTGAAATLAVPYQVPYLVSGAVLGIALVGAGVVLLDVHAERVEAAEERADLAALQRQVLRELRDVAEAGDGPTAVHPGSAGPVS